MFYTIKKGNHFASLRWLRWPFFFGNTMQRSVIFNESCKYDLQNSDQQDWNKLFGFSIGFNHMRNSARFAYRWNVEKQVIEIAYFYHENGEQNFGIFTNITLNSRIILSVYKMKAGCLTQIFFRIYGDKQYTFSSQIPYKKYGYKLYPYFGGNQAAPHDIKISISKP